MDLLELLKIVLIDTILIQHDQITPPFFGQKLFVVLAYLGDEAHMLLKLRIHIGLDYIL